jgi:hypothetical protein
MQRCFARCGGGGSSSGSNGSSIVGQVLLQR